MHGIIYLVVNNITNKIYVGMTNESLNKRKSRHLLSVKYGSKTHFHNSIRKHKIENFTWFIIDCANSKKELLEKEIRHIKNYNSLKYGYNLTIGGESISGYKWTDEQKSNQRKVQKESWERIKKQNRSFRWSIERKKKYKEQMKNVWTKERRIQHSKLIKDLDINANNFGKNNPNSKKFILIDPNRKEYIVSGTLKQFCKENNISFDTIRKHKNKGIIQINTRKEICKNTNNWEIKTK